MEDLAIRPSYTTCAEKEANAGSPKPEKLDETGQSFDIVTQHTRKDTP
ncbi:pentatricopeptide repeat-containing protein At2g33680 [Acetobacter orientalis]|uniref:Pentatricopeptide repeat-containing protein At2g33680 n=1 Tax=Acetobacter orientalis TaxID=146474 RepID=A0A2Z5ZJP2_9PROT|nr:pentatricopeptide repeat-containing protein At2g33680 [Acetobacter orientalis]